MNIGDIEINEKLFKKIMYVFIVLIVLFVLILLTQSAALKPYHMGVDTKVSEGEIVQGVVFEQGSRMLEISGYAYKKGQKIERFDSDFVLKNTETGKMYKMNTTMVKNHDLMSVDGMYDCSNAGMTAKAFISGLKEGIYEICIIYGNDGEDIFSSTGVMVEIK